MYQRFAALLLLVQICARVKMDRFHALFGWLACQSWNSPHVDPNTRELTAFLFSSRISICVKKQREREREKEPTFGRHQATAAAGKLLAQSRRAIAARRQPMEEKESDEPPLLFSSDRATRRPTDKTNEWFILAPNWSSAGATNFGHGRASSLFRYRHVSISLKVSKHYEKSLPMVNRCLGLYITPSTL